jgi:hypothetical protein
MTNFKKNMVSVVALMLFMLGSTLTIIGIFRTNELSERHIDESLIIPSQVINGITVMFLLYLTSTSSFSPAYKLLVIFLLVGGLIIEIYLTSYADRQAESIAAYIFVSLNLLIRAFFLIDLVQGEWVKPFTGSIKPVQQLVKETVVKPVEKIVKEVIPTAPKEVAPKSEVTQDASQEIQMKWNALKKIIESRPEGIDPDSEKDAWRNVVRPAKDTGRTDVKQVLREAAERMKGKDGSSIPLNTVDAIGGSKRS